MAFVFFGSRDNYEELQNELLRHLLVHDFSLQERCHDCVGGFRTEQYSYMHFSDQQDHSG